MVNIIIIYPFLGPTPAESGLGVLLLIQPSLFRALVSRQCSIINITEHN